MVRGNKEYSRILDSGSIYFQEGTLAELETLVTGVSGSGIEDINIASSGTAGSYAWVVSTRRK